MGVNMNKEIVLQKSIDYLADMILLYRVGNVSKEDLTRCINNVIYLFITMNREREIRSFLLNSFGCGVMDREFFTDVQLYWLGKFRGDVSSIRLTDNILQKVVDLYFMMKCGIKRDYEVLLEDVLKDLMLSDDMTIYDLCYIAKWASIYEYDSDLPEIIVNYVYAKYRLSGDDDKLVDYWFGLRKAVDDLLEQYSNVVQYPEMFSRVVRKEDKEYYVGRIMIDYVKYQFFVVPYKIFTYRISDGVNSKFVVYDLLKGKSLGGINSWSDLIDYMNDIGIKIKISPVDRVWMGVSDFFKMV